MKNFKDNQMRNQEKEIQVGSAKNLLDKLISNTKVGKIDFWNIN